MSYVSIPHAKERGEWGELCSWLAPPNTACALSNLGLSS